MFLQLSKVIVIMTITWVTIHMENSCDQATQCPENSICNYSLKTCKCIVGFIGNCNTPALPLHNQIIEMQLNSSNLQYFSISPLQINQFIDIRVNICQFDSPKPLVAYLWGETGKQIQFNPNYTFILPMLLTFEKNCSIIVLSNIYFYSQKNGESQKLILGLQNRNLQNVIIQLSIQQKKSFGIYISHYFTLAILMLLLVSFCGCMLINIFRRRRVLILPPNITYAQNREQDYNIDYFQRFLPKKKIEDASLVEIDCPVCLQNIQKEEIVRKTPCQHIFHSGCLDAWCKKNVNCPVCRSDLSYEYLTAIKQSLNVEIINKNKKYIKNWEEEIELEDHFTGDTSIKQEML